MGAGFHFGATRCFGTGQRWRLYPVEKVLNATEVYP